MKIDPVKYQSSFFERSFFKRIKRHFEHMIRKQPEMCYQSFLLHIHYSIKVHTPEHYCPYHRNVMVGSNPFPNIHTRTVSTIPEPHYPYHLPFKKIHTEKFVPVFFTGLIRIFGTVRAFMRHGP